MKERIKRFYDDHKVACNIVASTFAVTALAVLKTKHDAKIVSADVWKRDDGMLLISVRQKNGIDTNLTRKLEDV